MKKVVIGVVIVLVVAAIIGAIVMFVGKGGNSNTQTGIKVQTVEEMQEVFNTINTIDRRICIFINNRVKIKY